MCTGKLLRTAVSPISTSAGRAALTTGVAGAVMSAGKRKRPVATPPVLEPTRSLNNSSLFNSSAWGT